MSPTYAQGTNAQGQGQGSIVPTTQTSPSAVPTYTAPTSLGTSNLTPTTAINLPTPPTPTLPQTNGTTAVLATNNATLNPPSPTTPTATSNTDLNSLFQQYLGTQTPPPSEASQYESTYGITPAQAQQQQATAQADLNTKNQSVKDAQSTYDALQAQINGLDYQSNSVIPNQNLQDANGKNGTIAGVNAATASQQRTLLLQKAPLQLQALTAQANLAHAQGNATLAAGILQQASSHLDALFTAQKTDATNQYNYKTSLNKAVYDYASAAEKTILDNQQKAQDQAHADQLAMMNDVHSQASALLKTDPQSAAKLMALDPKSSTYAKDAAAIIASIKTDTGTGAAGQDVYSFVQSLPDTKGNTPQASLGGLTANGLKNAAELYLADNGKMPSLGLGSSAATQLKRNAIVNYGGAIADSLNMTLPQISAMYKADSTAASQIVQRVAKIDATSASLANQFPRLAQLADSVGNLGITESDLTASKATVARKFGGTDAANYIELINTVRQDYAAMQAAVGGSRGGEFFSQSAKDAIPLGLTGEQYRGLQQTIQLSAGNAQKGTQETANKLIGNIGNPSQNLSSSDSSGATVQSNGQSWTVGQVYNDGTGNWMVDAQGKWTKQ